MLPLLPIVAALAVSQDFEVRPATLSWEVLGAERFDRRWTLPEERREGRDLLAEMRRLAELRFAFDDGGERSTRCFGDLVASARERRGPERMAWFERLREHAPELIEDWGAGLGQLLLDDRLQSEDWDPLRDYHRDGLLIGDDWELAEEYGAPWTELEVVARMAQAATLIHADLATIKAVENDYRIYPTNIGSDYEAIFPLKDRYFRGEAPGGLPFSLLDIEFRCDLPFPFSDYTCRLHMLNRFDSDGNARTDIYSTSPDFHYLAGRDVFLPVLDSKGETVALLVVRHFGFDLDGVPDDPAHRIAALRVSLGNLKRNAEARFAAGEKTFGPATTAIAGMRVLGSD